MVAIWANKISSITREHIEKYNGQVKIVNLSTIFQVGNGIARIYVVDEVMAGEIVEFEEDVNNWEKPRLAHKKWK